MTTSVWEEESLPHFASLSQDSTADICVIGAGIAGLVTAYELSRRGRRVVVLEAEQIAQGETRRTTAHVTSALDDRFTHLESLFGQEGARTAAASHTAAIELLRALVERESIECHLETVKGYLLFPQGGSTASLPEEFAAASRAGLAVRRIANAPLPRFASGECLEFSGQAQFHPLKFLGRLAQALVRNGGSIHGGSRVIAVEDGAPASVRTERGHTVSCDAVVVATNSPINDRVAIHTKQAPYRTYVVGFDIAANAIEPALYWDTENPYHYVRIARTSAGDRLIVGGEDHKTAQAQDYELRFNRLDAWTRERFPVGAVTHRWSGQVMEPVDGLAYIGRNPGDRHVYIATGDSGHGMTHALIAGSLIPDLIEGQPHPAAELYDPARKTLRSLGEYAKENLNVTAQFREYVTSGDVHSLGSIVPGEGAVIRRGLHKIAAYRDLTGKLHECSAVCTHIGCVVAWNSLEKSWDCPCHGSRFDPLGMVIAGPARSSLAPIESEGSE